MRFNDRVEIFAKREVDDGQGGFSIENIYHDSVKANVLELPLEEVQKAYGTTEIKVIKVVLFTKYDKLDKLRWNDIMFDIKRLFVRGNKTYLTAEESDE